MIIIKQQDTRLTYKSQMLFYIPVMNKWNLKLRKKNTIYISTQNKYLGINLTKYAQDLCKENCKTLVNKINKELNKWRDIPDLCQFFPAWSIGSMQAR